VEIALALLLGAGGVLAGWYWRRRVAPRQTPMFSIADAPEAVVIRLVGIVRVREETLVAPLSGKTCCYYEARATDRAQVSPVIAEEFRCVEFLLDDGTGKVVIDAGYSQCRLEPERAHSTWLTAATPEQVQFCEQSGYQGSFLSVHFQERRIEPGMTIAVIGYLDKRPGGGLKMRPFTITAENEWLHPEIPEARVRRG
jgi:hypothetical protein